MDLARVIGWALEKKAAGWGHRLIARTLGVPSSTVRGWLRSAHREGMMVASRLWAVAVSADPGARAPPPGLPVVVLVAACHLAAGAVGRLSGEPTDPWSVAVAVLGGRLLG